MNTCVCGGKDPRIPPKAIVEWLEFLFSNRYPETGTQRFSSFSPGKCVK